MLASVALITSFVLVLALLGLPRRGSEAPVTTTAAVLVRQGLGTLQTLNERQDHRLRRPGTGPFRPSAARRPEPCGCAA
ncbi:hypothetical protein [Aquipuribacter sp. SD81]|uniref:hypothetical protein n=1 Tax=Aquipuribacter sp. SD81 TaxID=3127703 RepID=UPI00301690DF